MKQIENNAVSDLLISFGTHAGMVGKNNEDFVAFAAFDSGMGDVSEPAIFHLGIVADGVGGQTAGERASRLATNTIVSYFAELESLTIEQVNSHLDKAILQANNAVLEEALATPKLKGMATTIALVAILDGLLFTAHVGDSRIYLFRDQTLYQLTNDHSWVQEALEAGIITDEEARNHPNRNIIRRSLGTLNNISADQVMMSSHNNQFWQGMPLKKGDTLLICSDGLTDMINDADVQLSLEKHPAQMSDLVVELIDKANHAGGKDNTTVMTIKTSDNFSPNQLTPIPPPSKMVAPPTIRSIPVLTSNLIQTYNSQQASGLMGEVDGALGFVPKDKRPTIRTHAFTESSPAESLPSEEEGSQFSPLNTPPQPDQLGVTESSSFQQIMVRIVISLTVVVVVLTVLMLVLGFFLS